MTDEERARRFAAERAAQLRRGIRMQRDTSAELRKQLEIAARIIRETLAGATSDFRRWQLTALQQEVTRALMAVAQPATSGLLAGISDSWAAGAALIDAPLTAAGVDISAFTVRLDPRLLHAMRDFGTERIRDVTVKLANRINGEIAQAAIGTQTPFQAAQKVNLVLQEGGIQRAGLIVRDSLGRAYSVAQQQRQVQAAQVLPGLQKQWRRSGKLHSRHSHDMIDGQIRDVDKPFDLPGGVQLMCPRDPAGPIGETINCGCTSLPFMKHWRVSTPAARAFTAEEIKGDVNKRRLAELRGER